MDPIQQIFLQAQAPTGKSNTGYEAFVEGQRGARQNRELQLKEEEQAAMLPIQLEQARLTVNSQLLDINLKRNQLERDNQIKAGQSEALQIMLDAAGLESGYLDPSITERLRKLSITNPAVFTSPTGQAAISNWKGAKAASDAFTRAGMLGLPPKSIAVTDEGRTTTTFQDVDPLAERRLEQGERRLDLGEEHLGLRKKTLTQDDIRLQAQALRDEADRLEKGQTLQPGPTGQLQVVQGPKPLTTANVTAAQQDILGAEAAISSINKSIEALTKNPDAAGFEGFIKEIYEGVGGQLGLKPGTRITGTRTQLRDTANQLVVGLRVESGAMSNWERKMLEDMGALLDKTSDAEAIKTRLDTIKRLIAVRTLRLNPGLHTKPSPTVLHTLSDIDLANAKRADYLTEAQARAEYERRGRK